MSSKDLHALAYRGNFKDLTIFVNQRVCVELALRPDDTLIDIGCGDGTLLQMARERGVSNAVGTVGPESEAAVLRAAGFDVRSALVNALPFPSASASVVVCNSVLLLVPEEQMPMSLSEIARVCAPGARVWLGEVPRTREPDVFPVHKSIPQMLWYVLTHNGPRSFLGMCRRLIDGRQKGPVLRHPTQAVFYASPERFTEMALKAGLRIERHRPHTTLSHDRQPHPSRTREDYLLRRI